MSKHQNSEVITKGKIDKAINLLKEQKPKEREDISDREAIRKMRRYIEKLTSNKYGYTYDEVSEMLKGLGINLTGSRIKYLIGELKKSSRQRKKTESEENNQSLEPAAERQGAVKASGEADKSSVNNGQRKRKNQQPAVVEQNNKPESTSQANRSGFVPQI